MSRFLHVANGTSTTKTVAQAGIPGRCSIWADPLHEGPVPADLSDAELIQVRARHLSSSSGGLTPEDVAAELTSWRTAIDNDEAFDEIVLWYEHDLFDQLNLIQVLSRLGRARPRASAVTLICIGSFPGRPRFKGLGELTAEELGPLFATRLPVSDAQYDLATRAWDAFRAPDPTRIEHVLRADTSALPFLGPALSRHLEEFPSASDGLSRTERRLLNLAGEVVGIREAFSRMHDLEHAFYIADTSWWAVVEGLSFSTPALIELEIPGMCRSLGQLPEGTLALSAAGRAVLEGSQDRIRLCGFDRWLGGVHLAGSGPMWRWKAGALELA